MKRPLASAQATYPDPRYDSYLGHGPAGLVKHADATSIKSAAPHTAGNAVTPTLLTSFGSSTTGRCAAIASTIYMRSFCAGVR